MAAGQSGRQLGAEHAEKLRAYLDRIDVLPSRDRAGKLPNVSAISDACGFDRGVLYNNPACKKLLADAIARKGLRWLGEDISAAAGPEPNDRTKRLEARVHELEQDNAALMAANAELRAKIRRYANIEAHLVMTGRLPR